MISVIVPTISGREDSLKTVVAAYEETLADVEHEIIVVKDYPTWPDACNEGFARSVGDILHFSADDLEPLPAWYKPALDWLDEYDELPAARVWDRVVEGPHLNTEDGGNQDITWFTRVPICTRDQYERIGTWPSIIYLADVWFSEKARSIGIETRLIFGYDFLHHRSDIGRVDSPENMDRSWRDMEVLRREM